MGLGVFDYRKHNKYICRQFIPQIAGYECVAPTFSGQASKISSLYLKEATGLIWKKLLINYMYLQQNFALFIYDDTGTIYCLLWKIYWTSIFSQLTKFMYCIMASYFQHLQCLWVIWAAVLLQNVIMFSAVILTNCNEASHWFYRLVQPQQQGGMSLNFGIWTPSPVWEERQYLALCWVVQAQEEVCLQTWDAPSCYTSNFQFIAKPSTRKEIWLLG